MFGEILGPDGSVLTPPATISSSTLDVQNGKNNSKKSSSGSGFGSMSQWSGPGHGTGPTGRNSDLCSSFSSSHNGKDSAMLSDLPRKVRACVILPMYECLCLPAFVFVCGDCVCGCVSSVIATSTHLIITILSATSLI